VETEFQLFVSSAYSPSASLHMELVASSLEDLLATVWSRLGVAPCAVFVEDGGWTPLTSLRLLLPSGMGQLMYDPRAAPSEPLRPPALLPTAPAAAQHRKEQHRKEQHRKEQHRKEHAAGTSSQEQHRKEKAKRRRPPAPLALVRRASFASGMTSEASLDLYGDSESSSDGEVWGSAAAVSAALAGSASASGDGFLLPLAAVGSASASGSGRPLHILEHLERTRSASLSDRT
jgi:hypothetical protein